MIRRALAILLCAAATAIAGCAVEGRPFEKVYSSPRDAVIYVYRPYRYAASLLRPVVTCGEDTARIGPGGYHAFIEPPGRIVCRVETAESGDQVEIHAQPRTYYIREEIGWGVLTGHPHLNPIDTDQAQGEIEKCCVLEPEQMK
jgi:hypothetical protein